MTFDEVREEDGLDELDLALAIGMEESRPIYSILSGDFPQDDDKPELEETLEIPA